MMSEEIVTALIAGCSGVLCAIVTGIISARSSTGKTSEAIRVAQAVTDTKIEELTREVREHNGFARRMPVVEEQIKVANHRIADTEQELRDIKNRIERGQ